MDFFAWAVLSPDSAVWWLSIGEIALVGCTVLLVTGLLGAHMQRWHSWHTTCDRVVIIGVVGALIAAGGIVVFSRRLQTIHEAELSRLHHATELLRTENLALQSTVARLKQPRNLSEAQQGTIAHTLKRFSGTPYMIGIPASGVEPGSDLIQQVLDVLTAAGWERRPPPQHVLKSPSDPRFLLSLDITGVKSVFHSSRLVAFEPAARALSEALNAAGILAEAHTSDDKPNIDAIRILIGTKP